MRSNAGMAKQTRGRRATNWSLTIAGTPNRVTSPQRNRAPCPRRNRAFTARVKVSHIHSATHGLLPVNSSSGSHSQRRCRRTTRQATHSARRASRQPSRSIGHCSAQRSALGYTRRSSAYRRTGHSPPAPSSHRATTLSHSVIAPYCKRTQVGTNTSTSTPSSISVRPFSGPHIILKEWFMKRKALKSLHLVWILKLHTSSIIACQAICQYIFKTSTLSLRFIKINGVHSFAQNYSRRVSFDSL